MRIAQKSLLRVGVCAFVCLLAGSAAAASTAAPPSTARLRVDQVGRVGKIRAPRGAWGLQLELPASNQLAELEIRVTGDPTPLRVLSDLRPAHAYRIAPDPCCQVAILDDDSDLRPERRDRAICENKQGQCEGGMISVPSWIANDARCGDAHTCVQPIVVRFDVAPEAVAGGPLSIAVSDPDQESFRLDRSSTDDKATQTWHPWPWSRETSAVRVDVRRGTQVLWSRFVQLRLEHRYRIVVPADPAQLSIVRER